MRRRISVVTMSVVLMLFGSIFTALNASAHIETNGTVALGCSGTWEKSDDATRFTIQVTCTSTETRFAWGWKAKSDWTEVDADDGGMKWTFSPSGPDGGTHPYNMGGGDQAHGSFGMPNNTTVSMRDAVTLTNLEFGEIFSAVIADFSFGTNPCLGKPSSECPQIVMAERN